MRLLLILPVLVVSVALATASCRDSSTSADDADAGGDAGPSYGQSPEDGAADTAAQDAPEPPPPDAAIVGAGNDHCAKATVIPLTAPRAELHADTTAATHDTSAGCAADSGPDVFYEITLSKHALVYADTFGASWNTVLFLLGPSCEPITTSTMKDDALCSDDACGTSQSQVVALLAPGKYHLGLGGSGGATGAATIHFELALAPSGTETPLPSGTSEQSGTTTGQGGNVDNQSAGCIAAGPENGYWWMTCPSDPGGKLHASTCGGATWETLLVTEVPRARAYACSLDSCDLQTEISSTVPPGAGLHVLMVDGQSANASGPYTMQVTRP